MKNKNKERKGTFLLITDFVDKHLKCIVIISIIVAALFPPIVTGIYSCDTPIFYTDISADALLTYCGNIFGWCIALVAAAITVFQARKVQEMGIQAAEDSRRTKIKPSITIIVEENYESDIFVFQFYNSNDYDAIGINLFDTPLFPLLKRQDTRKKSIAFGKKQNLGKAIIVDLDHNQQISENGLPKEIELIYFDIDHNLIIEKYRYYKEEDNLGYEYVSHVYEEY